MRATRRDVVKYLAELPIAGGGCASLHSHLKNGNDVVNTHTPSQSDSESWDKVQYNKARLGGTQQLQAPGPQLNEAWSINIQGDGYLEHIVISDGQLFVDNLSINPQTGYGQWENSAEGFVGTYYYENENIYICDEENLYSIDSNDGQKEWSIEIPAIDYIDMKVLVTNDLVLIPRKSTDPYSGRADFDIVAVSISNQEIAWETNWNAGTTNRELMFSADSDKLYYSYSRLSGRYSNYGKLGCLNVSDGSKIWESSFRPISSPPVVLDNELIVRTEGGVFAVDKDIGNKLWEFDTEIDWNSFDAIEYVPAVMDGRVILPVDNHLYCVDISGEKIWKYEQENRATCSPIIVQDTVYQGFGGDLYLFDLNSGEIKNKYNVDSEISTNLAVYDNKIFFGTENRTLYALAADPNEPPVPNIQYSPTTPLVNSEVSFDASESTDDGTISEFNWDFGNDGTYEKQGEFVNHVFTTPGQKEVVLTTIDNQGESKSTSKNVQVHRANQVPTATFEYTPSSPQRGDTVTFDATASNSPDGSITTYRWEINGEEKYGEQIEHTFEEAGEYTVSLEVTDDTDLSDSTQQVVEIENEQLSVTVTGDQTDVAVGEIAVINISLVNFLTNNLLTAQLVLQTPSGVSVSGVSGAEEGSGQFTAVTEINPGSETNMLIQIQVNEAGEFPVTGRVIYVTEDGSESEQQLDTVTISTIEGESGSQSGGPESTDGNTDETDDDVTTGDGSTNNGGNDGFGPGLGVGSTLTAIGGLGYLLKRRLTEEDNEP